MADLPVTLEPTLADSLGRALDVEGKIGRALEALGPVAQRDVVLVGAGASEQRRMTALGARVATIDPLDGEAWSLGDSSADAVVSAWSAFRGADAGELAEAERVLRPGGRLLVVHDYGRDDVSRLRGDLPEYGTWSRRNGPFLSTGFRLRVIHCFWTFASLDEARTFLAAAFGDAGTKLGDGLTRPRLSYNVAVYHRTRRENADPLPA